MMPTPIRWLLLLALVLAAPAVAADTLRYRLTGVTGAIDDPNGVLGAPAPGTAFQLDYLADFSLGWRSGGGGGGGGANWLEGGASFADNPFAPNITLSPVSAVLTIAGHELAFSGAWLGEVNYSQLYGSLFGGPDTSSALLLAQARASAADPLTSEMSTALESPTDASVFGLIDRPMTLAIDGVAISGSATFTAPGVSGSLQPLQLAVGPVPEPASWGLLALGLAGLPAWRRLVRRPAASSAPDRTPARTRRTPAPAPTA